MYTNVKEVCSRYEIFSQYLPCTKGKWNRATRRKFIILKCYDSGVLLLCHFICTLSIVCYCRKKFDGTEKFVRSWGH
jgi:hypothetical protein